VAAYRGAQADEALERFLSLDSRTGAAWVMRGVCAIDRGEFTTAGTWLHKGVALGVGESPELLGVALSGLALALVKTSQFDLAMAPLTALARQAPDAPGLDADPIVLFLAEDAVTIGALRRKLGGRVLTFSAEGDLLRDRETGSSWDPLTGRARTGPLAGRSLEPLVVTTALWYA
jgi:hypothetical protein